MPIYSGENSSLDVTSACWFRMYPATLSNPTLIYYAFIGRSNANASLSLIYTTRHTFREPSIRLVPYFVSRKIGDTNIGQEDIFLEVLIASEIHFIIAKCQEASIFGRQRLGISASFPLSPYIPCMTRVSPDTLQRRLLIYTT